jgi:outer membrane murein-binding lipoprotein Lpp
VQERVTEPKKGFKTRTQTSKSEALGRVQARLDEIHTRIQSKLDELHTDFRQLRTDLRDANQSSARARKDRITGFKQALRDLLEAADRADREWY